MTTGPLFCTLIYNIIFVVREISPIEVRGRMGIMTEMGVVMGILLANILGNLLPDSLKETPTNYANSYIWRIVLLVPVILIITQVLFLLFVFKGETPKYLFAQSEYQNVNIIFHYT